MTFYKANQTMSKEREQLIRQYCGDSYNVHAYRLEEQEGQENHYFLHYSDKNSPEMSYDLVRISDKGITLLKQVQTTKFEGISYYNKKRQDFFAKLISCLRHAASIPVTQGQIKERYKYKEYNTHFYKEQKSTVLYDTVLEIFTHESYVTQFSFMRRNGDPKYFLLWSSYWYEDKPILGLNAPYHSMKYYFGDYLLFNSNQQVQDAKDLILAVFEILKKRENYARNIFSNSPENVPNPYIGADKMVQL